jgi:hypothetical protein
MVKHTAVRGLLLYQETLFDELRDCLRDFRRQVPQRNIEYPPVKVVQGALCMWILDQIVENFRRWRWKLRVGAHTSEQLAVPEAGAVPSMFSSAASELLVTATDSIYLSIPPSKTGLDEMIPVRAHTTDCDCYHKPKAGQSYPTVSAKLAVGIRAKPSYSRGGTIVSMLQHSFDILEQPLAKPRAVILGHRFYRHAPRLNRD